jgi:hypothetical protein
MQQPAPSAPSPDSPTFAGLLAALAAPGEKRPSAWDMDGLEDDVATLSYERALRAHARYKAPETTGRALNQSSSAANPGLLEGLPAEAFPAAQTSTAHAASASTADAEPEATHGHSTQRERDLKCASITIRLSNAECAQLRKRAAEAGLTVSAYLRSCTFEAESLRALVKDTLARLRSDPSQTERSPAAPARRSWRQRLARLWPQARAGHRIAQA